MACCPSRRPSIRQGQSATTSDRWGDYTTMTVDPVDDCTFWYTGDSTAAGGFRQSSIASFRFSDCATDLEISKTVSPAHPNAGEEIVYTITVTNDGPIGAANVVVTDQLPAAFNYLANTDSCTGVAVGATGTLTCPLGHHRRGVLGLVPDQGLDRPRPRWRDRHHQHRHGQLGANESDPADNTIGLTHLVNELADVRVTKVCKPDTEPAPAGTSGVCTIWVTNDGPSAARLVNLVDTHVSDGPFRPVDRQRRLRRRRDHRHLRARHHPAGRHRPGRRDRRQRRRRRRQRRRPGDERHAAGRHARPEHGQQPGQRRTVVRRLGRPVDHQERTGHASTAGTNLTYTLTVDNAGPSTAANVVVTDELPADVDFVSAVASVGTFTAVNGTVTWNLGNVAPGDPPRTLDITVFVHPDATGQLVNNAAVSSKTSDPDTDNNRPPGRSP